MKMHWCTGKLNLSGQGFHVLVINVEAPISWPEAAVVMALHGEENLFEIKPCAISETTPIDEKNRLLGKYGPITEKVFPGRSPRMEMVMPGESEDQTPADEYGHVAASNGQPKPPPPPDDDDDDAAASRDPSAAAVMKPGRHTPPHKGV